MSESFHNTTNERGETLRRAESKAKYQDAQVLALFRKHAPLALSPSQVHRALATKAPLTSIRRAITNLTAAELLARTDMKVRGVYGRSEFKWRLKGEPEQQRLL